MASEAEHIASANRTQKTIAHLLADAATHSPWIATAAFYKALQIVEAVFANDRQIGHTSNHGDREATLKKYRKYETISEHYGQLARAATNARYLPGGASFDDYMPPEDVINDLLKHHLRQVEKSAAKFIKRPADLVSIETAFN